MRISLKPRHLMLYLRGSVVPFTVCVMVVVAAAPGLALVSSAVAALRAQPAVSVLKMGARGPAVRAFQDRLARLAYLPSSGIDGKFGIQTWHAVVAFQGWHRLARDGVVGPRTSWALSRARRPTPWSTARGIEIHVAQQVLLLVSGGRVQRAIHVSTGANGATPLGHFKVYRRDPMSWSVPFHVWMPLAQYFYGGYAVHEFSSVPAYPASHGCVRVPNTDAQAVWRFGSIGMRVWTRP